MEGVAHHLHQKGIFDESKQQAFVMSLHILALLGKLCASLLTDVIFCVGVRLCERRRDSLLATHKSGNIIAYSGLKDGIL